VLLDADGPATALHFADFPSGHQIYLEGEPGERIYVIISGIVKITCTVAHGRQVVRALLGPGDVLDELTIFDAGPHSGTATCQSLVRTAWLNTSSLHRLVKLRPQLAQQWLQALARELRSRDEDLVSLTSTDVPGRVARQLILLAQRFGERADGRLYVSHSLTRREFAQLVGAARESVSKALANFVERGWIVTAPGGYEIVDLEQLRLRAQLTTPAHLAQQ
jgi:CRP-like cAMP-binding protein